VFVSYPSIYLYIPFITLLDSRPLTFVLTYALWRGDVHVKACILVCAFGASSGFPPVNLVPSLLKYVL
jgi:hypothetical protein